MKLTGKHSVDTFFKNKLRTYKHTPSDQLWERIQADLHDAPATADAPSKRLRWAVSVAALFVLSLGSALVYLTSSNSSYNANQLAIAINNSTASPVDDVYLTPRLMLESKELASKYQSSIVALKNKISIPLQSASKASPDMMVKLPSASPQLGNKNLINTTVASIQTKTYEADIAKKRNLNFNLDNLNTLPATMPSSVMFVMNDLKSGSEAMFNAKNVRAEKEKILGLKGAFIGVEGQANNTWILATNQETQKNANADAIENGNRIEYGVSITSAFGLRAGYNFNSRFGMETKAIKSSIKQDYTELREGAKYYRNITLDYIQLPLFFKYKWSRLNGITQHPTVINYKLGVQYSYLTNAVANINNQFVPMRDVLRKHDLGLVMGIDYDVFITRRMFASAGANVYYGSNLKAFPYLISEKEQRSNNFAIGASLSINYMLGGVAKPAANRSR